MRLLVLPVICAVVAASGSALAADSAQDPRAGLELGVRAGGGLYGRDFLAPLQLDVGYRVTRFVYAGTFFQRASNGSTEVTATGGLVRFHLTPARLIDPWFGIGAGYESLRTDAGTVRGLQWAQLSLGTETIVASSFVLGPYASAAFAGERTHTWFTFGLRGAFTL